MSEKICIEPWSSVLLIITLVSSILINCAFFWRYYGKRIRNPSKEYFSAVFPKSRRATKTEIMIQKDAMKADIKSQRSNSIKYAKKWLNGREVIATESLHNVMHLDSEAKENRKPNTTRRLSGISAVERERHDMERMKKIENQRKLKSSESKVVTFKFEKRRAEVRDIQLKEIKLVKKLAPGSVCEVYYALWRSTPVVVKILAPNDSLLNIDGAIKNFRRELLIISKLSHPNILQLIGASLTKSCYVMVMEYMNHGSLYDFLRDGENKFDIEFILATVRGIASGMMYMHEKNLLQRDIKSSNILLSANLIAKVADFGLSRFVEIGSQQNLSHVGTPMWTAPEIILNEDYDEKADVYSFGIVMWEIISRKNPYESYPSYVIPLKVAKEGLRPALVVDSLAAVVPAAYIELMKRCWDKDPKIRPSFKEILDIEREIKVEEAVERSTTDLQRKAESFSDHKSAANTSRDSVESEFFRAHTMYCIDSRSSELTTSSSTRHSSFTRHDSFTDDDLQEVMPYDDDDI